MRCLVGKEWEAERTSLKTIYIGLIRSVLDYGSIIFGSAANISLKRLDNIQYQALRLSSGAIRTTPTSALQVEMGEMPLELRRTQLSINYVWIEIQQALYRIQMMGISVIMVWIPAHIGIKGNKLADKCAKEATKGNNIDITVPFSKTEVKTIIKCKLKERWQKQWEEERKGRW